MLLWTLVHGITLMAVTSKSSDKVKHTYKLYVIYCVHFDWRYDKCRILEITSDSLIGMYCASRNYALVWICNCLQLFIVLTGSYMIYITTFREDILNTSCSLWFVDFLFIILIGIVLEMSDGEMLNKGHLTPVYLSSVSFLDKMPAVLVLEHKKKSVRNVSISWCLRWPMKISVAVCKKWMWVTLVYLPYVIYIHIIITVFLIYFCRTL